MVPLWQDLYFFGKCVVGQDGAMAGSLRGGRRSHDGDNDGLLVDEIDGKAR